MASPSFQQHSAWFEKLAALVGLCAMMALMLASFESVWFFFLEPLEDAWPEFEWCLLRAFVAVAALFSVLALAARWLPRRRLLRWPVLVLIIVGAAAVGWLAEDGLTWLLSGEAISDGERPYMVHTMVVLAVLAVVLRKYRWASLNASALLHEAELNRIRLQSELTAGRRAQQSLLSHPGGPRLRRADARSEHRSQHARPGARRLPQRSLYRQDVRGREEGPRLHRRVRPDDRGAVPPRPARRTQLRHGRHGARLAPERQGHGVDHGPTVGVGAVRLRLQVLL